MHKSLDFLAHPSIFLQQIASLNLCNLVFKLEYEQCLPSPKASAHRSFMML